MSCFNDYSNSENVVSTCMALDGEMTGWASAFFLDHPYSTVVVREPTEEILSHHYHIYAEWWLATIWNQYRTIRILINEIIFDQLVHFERQLSDAARSNLGQAFYDQLNHAKRTMNDMSRDICASVPLYLGYPGQGEGDTRPMPQAAWGNFLRWPLFVAAEPRVIPNYTRTWVMGRLNKIAQDMGIRQATILVDLLKDQKDVQVDEMEESSQFVGTIKEFVSR